MLYYLVECNSSSVFLFLQMGPLIKMLTVTTVTVDEFLRKCIGFRILEHIVIFLIS